MQEIGVHSLSGFTQASAAIATSFFMISAPTCRAHVAKVSLQPQSVVSEVVYPIPTQHKIIQVEQELGLAKCIMIAQNSLDQAAKEKLQY